MRLTLILRSPLNKLVYTSSYYQLSSFTIASSVLQYIICVSVCASPPSFPFCLNVLNNLYVKNGLINFIGILNYVVRYHFQTNCCRQIFAHKKVAYDIVGIDSRISRNTLIMFFMTAILKITVGQIYNLLVMLVFGRAKLIFFLLLMS